MSKSDAEFRWRRFPPLQAVLYVILRTLVVVLEILPVSAAPWIGRFAGGVARRLDRKHAGIAAKNLERSAGVVPPEGIPRFIDRVYDHLGLAFVEMFMMARRMRLQGWKRYARLERFDVVDRALQRGHGVIVVIGHLGNWELIGLAVTLAGYPLNSLARPIENPWADRFLNRFRTQTGQKIIPKYHALAEMIRVLQRNELLVIQADQDARRMGVAVDFFGRPASTHRSPALLSLKYGTPIIVADIFREKGLHHCVLSDPIEPEAFKGDPDPVRALTQALTSRLEECVRAHPDQWFWVHDRWKTGERTVRESAAASMG